MSRLRRSRVRIGHCLIAMSSVMLPAASSGMHELMRRAQYKSLH